MDSNVLESMKVNCYKWHLCFFVSKVSFLGSNKSRTITQKLYSYYKLFTTLFLNKCSTSLTFFSLNECK